MADSPKGKSKGKTRRQRGTMISAERLVTCDPARSSEHNPLGVIEQGAVVIDGGTITTVGTWSEVEAKHPDLPVHAHFRLCTPGLIDAHTHLPWAGSRHDEYVQRLQGASYEEMAAAGGGILSSMRSVRAASLEVLTDACQERLRRMARQGVTTVEAKTGYGLDLASEQKQLQALKAVAEEPDLPNVISTFLGLHALPPEANGDRDAYAKMVAEQMLPAILELGVAKFVDAYIDRSAFSVQQVRPTLEAAKRAGLGIRLHIGQFADVGGGTLAAELEAASVDHLEHLSAEDAQKLGARGTAAVMLPLASFTLGQDPPNVAGIRESGMPIVVASDANPGTAPTESLPLAMAMAARTYRLRPAEVLLGVTRHAAQALGVGERTGVLAAGRDADLVGWRVPHEHALLQPWGTPMAVWVARRGRTLVS